jgi:ribosomal protein S18 acetylase RimI-like enzyme
MIYRAAMEHILDNPVWHALTGPHASLAIGSGRARHYPRDVTPFSAVEHTGDDAFADLALHLPANTEARLFRPVREPVPAGWRELDCFPMLQMIAERIDGDEPAPASALGEADSSDMLDLVAISKPGPFEARTWILGTYLGIRDNGRLMAMAGIRMRVAGFDELSAICVHPEARGRGYAARLTRQLARAVLSEGRRPFLHVRPDNIAALSLYRSLGFTTRREIVVTWRKPANDRA